MTTFNILIDDTTRLILSYGFQTIIPGAGQTVARMIEETAINFSFYPDYYCSTLPVYAAGLITMTGIAVADETFQICGQTFTWKNARANPGEVTRGASKEAAAANIAYAVNLDLVGIVSAVDNGNGTVTVTSVLQGVIGNSYVFTEASTNMAMNGSGRLGGTTTGVDVVFTAKGDLTNVATWNKQTITADGSDAATLGAGLPNPTQIIIAVVSAKGAEAVAPFNVTDGSLVFKSLIEGEYLVTAIGPGYQPYAVTITAEP